MQKGDIIAVHKINENGFNLDAVGPHEYPVFAIVESVDKLADVPYVRAIQFYNKHTGKLRSWLLRERHQDKLELV